MDIQKCDLAIDQLREAFHNGLFFMPAINVTPTEADYIVNACIDVDAQFIYEHVDIV